MIKNRNKEQSITPGRISPGNFFEKILANNVT